MPKIKKLRQHALAYKPVSSISRTAAEQSGGISGEKKNGCDSTQGAGEKLSKGQKKRLESKQKVMRKLGLDTQHTAEFDKKLDPSLSNFEAEMKFILQGASNEGGGMQQQSIIKPAAMSVIRTNKMKKEVAVREAARMKLVLQHPTFQANPFDAINQHLTQMLNSKQDMAIATPAVSSSSSSKKSSSKR